MSIVSKIYMKLPAPVRTIYHRLKIAATLDRYEVLEKKHLTYAEDLLYTHHNADFLGDPNFVRAWNKVKEVGTGELFKDAGSWRWRFEVILWAASHAKLLDGDFVECGAYTGSNSAGVMEYIDFKNSKRNFFLLDTFKGMDPKYSTDYEMRRHAKLGYGRPRNVADRVRETFKDFSNVKVIEGPVPETLPQVTSDRIAYLSIDMNSVVPEQAALEYFWPKMVSGGVIIFDDYGYPGCEQQKQADDDFARQQNVPILPLPTCQAIIIKP